MNKVFRAKKYSNDIDKFNKESYKLKLSFSFIPVFFMWFGLSNPVLSATNDAKRTAANNINKGISLISEVEKSIDYDLNSLLEISKKLEIENLNIEQQLSEASRKIEELDNHENYLNKKLKKYQNKSFATKNKRSVRKYSTKIKKINTQLKSNSLEQSKFNKRINDYKKTKQNNLVKSKNLKNNSKLNTLKNSKTLKKLKKIGKYAGPLLLAVDLVSDLKQKNVRIQKGSTEVLEFANLALKLVESATPTLPFTYTPSDVGRAIIDYGSALKQKNKSLLGQTQSLNESVQSLITGEASINVYIARKLTEQPPTGEETLKERKEIYDKIRNEYFDNHFGVIGRQLGEIKESLIKEKDDLILHDRSLLVALGKSFDQIPIPFVEADFKGPEQMYKSLISGVELAINRMAKEALSITHQDKGFEMVNDFVSTAKKKREVEIEYKQIIELMNKNKSNQNEQTKLIASISNKVESFRDQNTSEKGKQQINSEVDYKNPSQFEYKEEPDKVSLGVAKKDEINYEITDDVNNNFKVDVAEKENQITKSSGSSSSGGGSLYVGRYSAVGDGFYGLGFLQQVDKVSFIKNQDNSQVPFKSESLSKNIVVTSADPFGAYQYTALEQWNSDSHTIVPFQFSADQNFYPLEGGFWVAGERASNIPRQGMSSYQGAIYGDYRGRNGIVDRGTMGGNIELQVVFSDLSISGNIEMTKNDEFYSLVSIQPTFFESESQLFFSDLSSVNGAANGAEVRGVIDGFFSGSGGAEIGGSWKIDEIFFGGTSSGASGVFRAKQSSDAPTHESFWSGYYIRNYYGENSDGIIPAGFGNGSAESGSNKPDTGVKVTLAASGDGTGINRELTLTSTQQTYFDGYNYVAWGKWSDSAADLKVYESDWVVVDELDRDQIPQQGTATYNGEVRGVIGTIGQANTFHDANGAISLNANFGTRAITGNMTVNHANTGAHFATATFNSNMSTSGDGDNLQFDGQLTGANISNQQSWHSTIQGSFGGNQAAEVGGTWSITKGAGTSGDERATGAFRAKKQ